MRSVPDFTHLYLRNGTYTFRAPIPQNLRPFFGGKTEKKKSLRTKQLSEARTAWLRETEIFDGELRDAQAQYEGLGQKHQPTISEAFALVRTWHWDRWSREEERLRSLSGDSYQASLEQYQEDLEFWNVFGVNRRLDAMSHDIIRFLCERARFAEPDPSSTIFKKMALDIHRSRLDICRRVIARLNGDTNDHPAGVDQRFIQNEAEADQERTNSLNPGSTTDFTLGDLIVQHVSDPSASRTEKTKEAYLQSLGALVDHFGANKAVRRITAIEMDGFLEQLLKRPKNNRQSTASRLETGEIGSVDAEDNVAISKATARKIVGRVKGFFNWCFERSLVPNNVAAHLKVQRQTSRLSQRRPFTVSELSSLFSAPLYTGSVDDGFGFNKHGDHVYRRSRYWLPLVALFTGMRLNEICQLWSDDIFCEDGVDVIRVDENEQRNQFLKTPTSARLIPVHPVLIAIGFLDWVNHQFSDDNPMHIFPDIAFNERRRNYSDTASKRFASLLKSCDLKGDGLCFHSFRHTFRDALREAEVGPGVVDRLGGWKTPGVSNQYGRGPSLAQLEAAISRVQYGSLDLSHLSFDRLETVIEK